MNQKNQKWILGMAMVAAAFGAIALAGSASATMSGDVYGGSGTWTINNPTTLDGQSLSVSGSINIFNTLTVTNASIVFTTTSSSIIVNGPSGSFVVGGAANFVTIGTNNADSYWNFTIASNAGNVIMRNVTLDNVWNGVRVNGGTQASRYFADVTITDAVNYGMQLTDSSATLLHVKVYLLISTTITESSYWSNYTYGYIQAYTNGVERWYIYSQIYGQRTRYLTATGTGIYIVRGSPWLDSVETHVPDVSQRINIELMGTYYYIADYFYSYGCPTGNDTYAFTQIYDYFYPTVDVYGFKSVDSSFAHFDGVRPPPENFSFDIHWNLVGTYGQEYYYGGNCQASSYSYPEDVYWLNGLYFYTANIVGVYVQNGGLTSIDQQSYAMGHTGVTITSDWAVAQWAIDYFTMYYSYFPVPQSYSLWSVETKTYSVFQAIVNTDFSLTNSLFTGAGVRIDRNYNYNAPAAAGGANDAIFRGTVLVDHVTVRGASAAALDIRVTGIASSTTNKYNYTARVTNSTLEGSQVLSLWLYNRPSQSTAYTADVRVANNAFSNGSFKPGNNYQGVLTIGTGGHSNSFASDWYKEDVMIDHNTFLNLTGPVIGMDYAEYRFLGGSSLTLDSNSFTNVGYYAPPLAGGGKMSPVTTDAFVKTNANTVAVTRNTFSNLSFIWGILGGTSGASTGQEYIAFSYCAMSGYTNYGCSWPYKTPTIDVSLNTFNGVTMTGNTQFNAFALAAGRGHITFNGNMINNSSARWTHALLNDYTYYAFPVTDIDIKMMDNVISNQTGAPVGMYTHPFKAANPFDMERNTYSDSTQPFFTWKMGWYASIVNQPPSSLAATIIFVQNTATNIALGGEGVVRLTGAMTVTNNTFDYITGWAVIAEKMNKIPSLAGNSITHSTNGFWLSPAVVSGLAQTATYNDLTVAVSETGIRMENGNLLMLRADFGDATTAVDMRNGFAEIYSSKIRVLSARVAGEASVTVYNQLGYEVHWAGANGVDSGVLVKNALVVTSTPDQQILSSGHTDNLGRIPAKTVEVWSLISHGTQQTSRVALPLTVLCFYGGITTTVSVPELAPGEEVTSFQDYDAYPLLLVDPIIPEMTIGSPLAGETVGTSNVAVQGYTFERGSGVAMERMRIDGGAWVNIPTTSAQWTVVLQSLPEGRHFLEYEVTDVATNRFTGDLEFFVDLTAPTLTVSSPLEESSLSNQPIAAVRGHVEPPTSVVALNGVTLTVNSRGDFFYNYSLSEGLNILRFTAMDAARNTVVVGRQITFDHFPPYLLVSEPVNGLLTRLRTVDVMGRSERDAYVTVNNQPAFVNPTDGTFSLPQVSLDDVFAQTENLLVIRAQDRAGNIQFENRTVIVDTKAPIIDLDFTPEIQAKIDLNLPVSVTSLPVKGTTDSKDAVITIGGQEVPLVGLSFGRVMVLREGLNVIVVTSEDDAGNQGSRTLNIVRDTVAPTITLLKPEGTSLLTNRSTLEIVGWTDAADATVWLRSANQQGVVEPQQVQTVAVGLPIQYRFEWELTLVPDGNVHSVELRSIDEAGNFATVRFDYTSKVNPPELVLTGFKDSTTDTFVWINGTTSQGIEKVRINGQDFDVVAQGFSVRWNLPIQHGNYTFRVSVEDAAGNRNVTLRTTEVNVPAPPCTTNCGGTDGGIMANPSFQVGAGAILLGAAFAVLAMTLSRRREVE